MLSGKKMFVTVYACICVCMAEVVHRLLRNSGTWEWLKCKAIRDEKIYVFTVVCSSGAHIFWILFKGVRFLMVWFVSWFMCSLVFLVYVGANGLSYCRKPGMSNPAVRVVSLLGDNWEWRGGGNASFGKWLDMPGYDRPWLVPEINPTSCVRACSAFANQSEWAI